MKISKFDKKNLQALRIEMQALLEKYGAQANLEIKVGNMSFSDAEVNIKVKATVIGAETFDDAILKTTAAANKLRLKNDSGDQLVRYNSRAHKMPWIYKCGKTGKMFKCDLAGAKRRFIWVAA
jgi:uncharacterized protein YejL (UPF0352 family)